MNQNPNFRYYLSYRPFGIGCQPEGHVEVESWGFSKTTKTPEGQEIFAFGWVEYSTRLTFDQIFSYQLFPSNKVEQAHYRLWYEEGRDFLKVAEAVDYFKSDIAGLPEETVQELCEDNPYFEYCRIVIEAGLY